MVNAGLPLSDVLVLDLTRARAGPTAVRQLADWGANAIKVEEPAGPDPDDGMGEARDGFDFQNLHRNKRSITLNLKAEEGKEVFYKLTERADVVVENYRPAVKERLGIDYETLRKLNPRIIYGSISGFGQNGPYRDRPGFDQIAQGMGGLMSVTGIPGQGPVRVGVPIADLSAGLYLAIGILVALHARERSGAGQWVHTSLLEAQIAMLDFQAARWTIGHQVPPQAGNDHPTGTPTGVFPTADGHINIAASGETIFRRLCRALGDPGLAERPDFQGGGNRTRNRAAVNPALAGLTATKTSREWIEILTEAGVRAGPIYTIVQTFADPQVQALAMARPVEHGRLGTLDVIAQAVNLEGHGGRAAARLASPDAGEHNAEVLGWLGYTPQDIAQLRERGVI